MAYVLARPMPREPPEDEYLPDSFQSSFHPTPSSSPPQQRDNRPSYTPLDSEMAREKGDKHMTVDILVNSDHLYLRGTGVDVAPALLSGNIVLYLSESTSLKQITLQFRGKARIPVPSSESVSIQANHITYLVCNHEWSFLEGSKGHSHTLKAGRHLFPFQLHLGGSLPSSINTTAFGGASVSYKLRANVVRSGFSLTHRDVQTICPIYLIRSFGAEALEYQQTLEIENTWPEKLMYSIMIPHKAWAAGERVTAVVKFSPLAKGTTVKSVTTSVNETIKVYSRTGYQEVTRAVTSTRHDMVDGHAVLSEERHHRYRIPLLHGSTSPTASTSTSRQPTSHSLNQLSQVGASTATFMPSRRAPGDTTPLSMSSANSSSSSVALSRVGSRTMNSQPVASTSSSSAPAADLQLPREEIPTELDDEPSADIITTLDVCIPRTATPTHSLEPIQISHRIRWCILILNRDGHTSELRCSLPLHVLDHRLMEEARAATLATRRLLLGSQEIEGGTAVGLHGESTDPEDDMELPSYPAHIRDRVANAFLPESGVMRVANPWVAQGVSPVIANQPSGTPSGTQSPLEVHPPNTAGSRDQLPAIPPPPGSHQQPLDWVNSELLLSLDPSASGHVHSNQNGGNQPQSPTDSAVASPRESRFPSRRGSRMNSRAASPEHPSSPLGHLDPNGSGETFVHNGNSSRHLHGLFHISMKPFSSLTNGFNLGNRSQSHTNLQDRFPHGHSHLSTTTTAGAGAAGANSTEPRTRSSSGSNSPLSSGMVSPAASSLHITPLSATARPTTQGPSGQMLLHRAFTETPDYETAMRGFLGGGVPPLDSFRDLPSYEDAAAERRRGGVVRHDTSDSQGSSASASSA